MCKRARPTQDTAFSADAAAMLHSATKPQPSEVTLTRDSEAEPRGEVVPFVQEKMILLSELVP